MDFLRNTRADAVVEATILFPIMTMIFAALVLLAVYLPTRAVLQHATQYTATALATEQSDTWLFYDDDSMSYYWTSNKSRLKNVYVSFFTSDNNLEFKSENMVEKIESRNISSKSGDLVVMVDVANHFIYREIIVSATRTFILPETLAFLNFIRFPQTIPITVTSTAVVQNGAEFIRIISLATDFVEFIKEHFDRSDAGESIEEDGKRVASLIVSNRTNN